MSSSHKYRTDATVIKDPSLCPYRTRPKSIPRETGLQECTAPMTTFVVPLACGVQSTVMELTRFVGWFCEGGERIFGGRSKNPYDHRSKAFCKHLKRPLWNKYL